MTDDVMLGPDTLGVAMLEAITCDERGIDLIRAIRDRLILGRLLGAVDMLEVEPPIVGLRLTGGAPHG